MQTADSTSDSTSCDPPGDGFLAKLGPGLVTGASDDDPSGIGTYSQAGAQFGYGVLWTMVFSLPLMIAVQEISARIGRVTGHGLAGNIRRFYPAWLLYPLIFLLVAANTINIGADLGAMGDCMAMLFGGPTLLYTIAFAILCIVLQVFASYPRCAKVLKWLTVVVFSYIGTVFCVHVPWGQALKGMVFPKVQFNSGYLSMLIAILGTTISPYLFFWQATQETEEINSKANVQPLNVAPEQARSSFRRIRLDTFVGMTLSNIVALCIILSTAATLHIHGATDIQTSSQAAEALRPLAGKLAFTIFALGIIGTGILAVPVLAGSAAYAVGEAMKWPTGLDRKALDAKGFYGVIIAATLVGGSINLPIVQHVTHITPIKALFWSAVINGVAAVPIMIVMMLMSQNPKIMGKFTRISKPLRVVGWLATAVMTASVIAMFATLKS